MSLFNFFTFLLMLLVWLIAEHVIGKEFPLIPLKWLILCILIYLAWIYDAIREKKG